MVDREDDVKIGVKSSAILFADMDRLHRRDHAGDDAVRAHAGRPRHEVRRLVSRRGRRRRLFFLYQQWLIRNREPAKCFRAFLNNHYVGLAIFIGILLEYVYDVRAAGVLRRKLRHCGLSGRRALRAPGGC